MTISASGRLSDLRDMGSSKFRLDVPMDFGTWQAPVTASSSAGWIVCSSEHGWEDVRAGDGMLDGFLRLADASADRIAQYAEHWGPLLVCDDHMLPVSHVGTSVGDPGAVLRHRCQPFVFGEDPAAPASTWRFWSAQARAILRIAIRLYGNEPGQAADWQTIMRDGLDRWRLTIWELEGLPAKSIYPFGTTYRVDDEPPYGEELLRGTRTPFADLLADSCDRKRVADVVQSEREDLAEAVFRWVQLGNVRPVISWEMDQPQVTMAGGGLFAAVGVQLMLRVAKTEGLALCSSCGEPYVPRRRPTEGRRRYCDGCRDSSAPMKDAVADYRRREKQRRRGEGRG